jgi:Mrp family chromosome partitioning ATPase
MSLNRPTVVGFISPRDGDGKTGLLADLAPQLAKRVAGNVLVVDANSLNPDLTSRLGLPLGKKSLEPDLIYPTNIERLNVLPCCPAGSFRSLNPSWIEDWREGWPLVLLDLPSLEHGETLPLACCCDGLYLVVRLGHTPRRAVRRAAQSVRRANGRLLGCAVIG